MVKHCFKGGTVKRYTILLILLTILIVPNVMGFEVSQFNNGESIENLTYIDDVSIVRYIDYPEYINITEASLNINKYNITTLNSNVFCFQPSANIASDCGGILGGYYSYTSSKYNDISNMFDGDYETFGYTKAGQIPDLVARYRIPVGATNQSLLQIKVSNVTQNLTIPQQCWDYGLTNYLQIAILSYNQIGGLNRTSIICYNGSIYTIMYETGNGIINNSYFYEESMFWFFDFNRSSGNFYNVNFTTNYTDASGAPLYREYYFNFTRISDNSVINYTEGLSEDVKEVLIPYECNYGSETLNIKFYDSASVDFLACQNSTGQWINIASEIGAESIEWDRTLWWHMRRLINVSVYINDTRIFNTTELDSEENIDFIDEIRQFESNCYSCNLPITFRSNGFGKLEYSDLSVIYDFNNYNVSINIYDSTTLSLLTNVNITTQYIGSEFQSETTTVTGQTQFSVNVSTVTDDVSLILFQTNDTDYSIVERYFTYTQGQNQNITIYMTNTTDATATKEVTFIVKDEDRQFLEDATIKIYKRDPATNQFLEVTDLTTNPNGEATTTLILNTAFYRFIVLYEGSQVYVSSSPYPISSSDDTITLNCVVGESYSEYYVKTQGFEGPLQFTQTSNESGYYTISYTSEYNVTVCLNTSYITNTVFFDNGISCTSGTSGILTSNTITVSQFSDVYGYVSLDFGGSEGVQVVNSLHNYLGVPAGASDTGRLVLFFGIIVLSGVAFIYVPVVGLIVFAIGTLILAFTKFTLIDIPFAMFIVGLTIFVIYVLKKNEK